MERTNLHTAINDSWSFHRDFPDRCGKHRASNLTQTGQYPELIQVRDREAGKTWLYVVDYGQRDPDQRYLVSDVCVLDYRTGKMTILPRDEVPDSAPFIQ